MYKLSLVLVFSVLSCQLLLCQTTQEKELTHEIESFMSTAEKEGFSGTVLLGLNGRKIWSGGYGYADLDNRLRNSPETVFDIGSVTKQFTAAAILKLEMQGKLSTADKLSEYLDGVPDELAEVTLHHLLTHSAGMPGAIGGDYKSISTDDFISKAFKSVNNKRVGKAYHYSNVGYSLLAIIIEKVSGMGYEAFLREYLFLPADMHRTGYLLGEWGPTDIAVGYRGKNRWGKPTEKKWAEDGPYLHLKGNGGILSTVEDLYKWHLALLGDEMLSKEAKEKYYYRHIKEDPDGRSYYGYGWALFPTPRDTYLVAHNGGNGIFFADFWRYLSEEITIIVSSNKSGDISETIASEIAGIVINKIQPQ